MKLSPILHEEAFAFVAADSDMAAQFLPDAICVFKEAEGITLVISESVAKKHGLAYEFRAAWITLSAETSLNALGITSTFSKVLADNGISCNVFAPIHHDHIFVPFEKGAEAVQLLDGITL
ncbi:MAG: ACT domain-containing protein [Alphaproteobacteria bacterium]|nr:ACT domain-containing protein [Alphaproteobacteria bacterium]